VHKDASDDTLVIATRPAAEHLGWRTFGAMAAKQTLIHVDPLRSETTTVNTTSPCHACQVVSSLQNCYAPAPRV